MEQKQYHATENQLEDSKSQLLSVFSSGNLEARSDICNGNKSVRQLLGLHYCRSKRGVLMGPVARQ